MSKPLSIEILSELDAVNATREGLTASEVADAIEASRKRDGNTARVNVQLVRSTVQRLHTGGELRAMDSPVRTGPHIAPRVLYGLTESGSRVLRAYRALPDGGIQSAIRDTVGAPS